jgi:hypothetical protein
VATYPVAPLPRGAGAPKSRVRPGNRWVVRGGLQVCRLFCVSLGTGKREGGGGLGAGTGASGPAPKSASNLPRPARPSPRRGCGFLPLTIDEPLVLASWSFLSSNSGWRLRGESDPGGSALPSIRVDRIHDRTPVTAFVNRRLEARAGGRTHLTHGFPTERPEPISVALFQPCPPMIRSRDRIDFFPFRARYVAQLVDLRHPFQTHDSLLLRLPSSRSLLHK